MKYYSAIFAFHQQLVSYISALLILAGELSGSAAADVIHYQRLKSFDSITNDGARLWSPLIEVREGTLYGTTRFGGRNDHGAIFKLNKDGSGYTLIHDFSSVTDDGWGPLAGLLEASDGFLYGTTPEGGGSGMGTIFKLHPDGSGYVILHSFTSGVLDGKQPAAELIEGRDGLLYGTTYGGGGIAYEGTVFSLNKDGSNFRILHRFGPFTTTDGSQPLAPLLEGSDGALYGTTCTGGGSGVGSVFKMNKDGSGYRKLHAFGWDDSAINPFTALIEGDDHALYGTAGGNRGGVFKLMKDGNGYQVLLGFDGDTPFGALVRGRDAALYGTTFQGGGSRPIRYGAGSIFRLKQDGSDYVTLHGFGGSPDGEGPHASLLLGSDGAFYGTTYSGGGSNRGTVFRLLVNRLPVVQCADVVVGADTNCSANASVDDGSYDPDGDPITINQAPSGPYPLGTNRVTLSVVDSHGDSNTASAVIIVLDATPPTITCSSNIIVEFSCDAEAVLNYTFPAKDSCDPNPLVTCVPPSGSTFSIGATTVNGTASDASGNSSSCSFTVTVLGARGTLQNVLAELIALSGTTGCGSNRNDRDGGSTDDDICRKLTQAIQQLRASLNPPSWIDEIHLTREHGGRVFHENLKTVKALCDILRSRTSSVPDALLQEFINRIFRADRLLASIAIQEAVTAGVSEKRIEQARKFLAKGDADSKDDKCTNGLEDYGRAWRHVARAQIIALANSAKNCPLLQILCGPNEQIVLQASSNLLDWMTIGTSTADTDGIVTFEDPAGKNFPVRYYRAVAE